ncbi:siphovirus Gp157 family protein [Methylobacterium sp. E-005]|uniref:siphovirus Gp157 family protein n=1 Tax=Methylobacterium sp. E-005 TaxID=2836549 RepID=UPI001FBBDB3A|nr:siphovirus Gp157 family protein [Methylobacterium sp. E-005]MCJ2090368.1 siphovirus Gp157 family protein [Methylobacterium sp. E-005]
MTAAARIPLYQEMAVASQVAAALIAAGIEPDDEDFAELMASETNIQDRLIRILRAARHTEALSKALSGILAEMRERKARLDNKAERLRGVVLGAMADLGLTKLDGPDLSATVNAGKPKVVITDEAKLPDDACIFKREPSKTAIAAALADGPIAGAEWSNAAPVLTVRTR